MHLLRDLRVPFGPQVISRLIRHLYAADIHWDALLHPGIMVVHGNGLVVSHRAEVKPGCILFQGVTLGESIDPVTRVVSGPVIDEGVHLGPNCVIVGPVHVGAGSKVMANVTLLQSVPARSVVTAPKPLIVGRSVSGNNVVEGFPS